MTKVKEQFFSGIIYTGLAKYSGIIISLVVTAILARLLLPSEFGVIAIATIFINFFASITVTGISPSIIQNKKLNKSDISNIFTFTFYLAIALSLIFVLTTPFIVSYYENSEGLQNICYLLTINIFFAVLTIVPNAEMLKNKEFKFISIRTIIVQLSAGIVAIVAALSGLGIYSLVINPVLGSILIFVITISKNSIPLKLYFDKDSIQKILKYSTYQVLFNIALTVYRSIDKILIGKYFNMTQLGYYEKSYRFMMLPLENVSSVINPVLHPILSEFQHNPRYIVSSYLKVLKILMDAGFLLSVYLFFSAREIILIFLGDQWELSVPVFKILALSVGIQLAQSPVGAIFQSVNKINKLFFCSVIILFIVFMAVGGGIFLQNLEYLALLLVLAFFIAFYVYNAVLFSTVKVSIIPVFKMFFKSLLISLCMAIPLFIVSELFSIKNIFLSLIINSLISLLYLITLLKTGILKDWPLPKFVNKLMRM